MLKPMYAYQDTTMHVNGGNCLMLLSKYPILSKERIPYESKGNMSVAYRLKVKDREVLLINNHLETTGLSLEDRRQFKNLVIGKLQVDTAEETSKLLVVKLAEATKKRAPEAEAVAKYIQQHKEQSIILCGDFNDGPISYAHRTIAKDLTDCYIASGNGPGISYHRGGFFVRIDNIMCSDDWEPYECKVDDKIAVSDHYPIICKLKMRPKKQK
jgi:endonuclease/exonuclease/phosphatase family metal-dependent hydrolase